MEFVPFVIIRGSLSRLVSHRSNFASTSARLAAYFSRDHVAEVSTPPRERLKWSDLAWQDSLLWVKGQKVRNKKGRSIPINEAHQLYLRKSRFMPP